MTEINMLFIHLFTIGPFNIINENNIIDLSISKKVSLQFLKKVLEIHQFKKDYII